MVSSVIVMRMRMIIAATDNEVTSPVRDRQDQSQRTSISLSKSES